MNTAPVNTKARAWGCLFAMVAPLLAVGVLSLMLSIGRGG